jgi:hypothetical protein
MQFPGDKSPKTPRNILVSKLVVQATKHTSHFELHICYELSVLGEGKEDVAYALIHLFKPHNQPLVVLTLRSIWDLKTISNITVFITWNYDMYIPKRCSYVTTYSDNQKRNILFLLLLLLLICHYYTYFFVIIRTLV